MVLPTMDTSGISHLPSHMTQVAGQLALLLRLATEHTVAWTSVAGPSLALSLTQK